QLFYHDGVRHHYISALATLDVAAASREQLLKDFCANSAESGKLGDSGAIRGFVLLEGNRPARTRALVQTLRKNGIEVHGVNKPGKVQAADTVSEKSQEHTVPMGSYWVPLNQ